MEDASDAGDLTRRDFVSSALIGTAAILPAEAAAQTGASQAQVTLKINGQPHALTLEPRTTLLDTLRERLQLTGTKKGCDHGQCGACTVLINGRTANSCLTLAIMCAEDEITTIEGLGTPDKLHPVQAAFIQHDGFQCGYCTSGQICSTVALLDDLKAKKVSFVTPDVRKMDAPEVTDDEIRERMSGNICRCAAYPNIVAAVRAAWNEGLRA